jgi:hypothetical protein
LTEDELIRKGMVVVKSSTMSAEVTNETVLHMLYILNRRKCLNKYHFLA